jgi:hypothetical protein
MSIIKQILLQKPNIAIFLAKITITYPPRAIGPGHIGRHNPPPGGGGQFWGDWPAQKGGQLLRGSGYFDSEQNLLNSLFTSYAVLWEQKGFAKVNKNCQKLDSENKQKSNHHKKSTCSIGMEF